MHDTITKQDIASAFSVIQAVAESIRDLGQIPAGHLYAQIMGKLDLDQFDRIIETLVNTGLVRKDPSGMLHWIEPKS